MDQLGVDNPIQNTQGEKLLNSAKRLQAQAVSPFFLIDKAHKCSAHLAHLAQ